MRFTTEDLDVDGLVTRTAIERETKLLCVPFAVTPLFLAQLYLIAVTVPVEQSNENIPPGHYIELQVGRHVESKYIFRFIF
jgi:NADH:ubiquinone oxidoreductase subunit 6 (subunit J)